MANLEMNYEGIVHITTSLETKENTIEFDEKDSISTNDKKIISDTILPIFINMINKYNGYPNISYGEYINDIGYIRVISSFQIKKDNEHFTTLEVKMFKSAAEYIKSDDDFNNSDTAGLEDFYLNIKKDYEVKFEILTDEESGMINIKPLSSSEPEKKDLGMAVISYAFQYHMMQMESVDDGEIIKVTPTKDEPDIIHIIKKTITKNRYEFTVKVFYGNIYVQNKIIISKIKSSQKKQ